MRKSRIICTLGPASNSIDMIEKLVLSGMNVARINLSHGDSISHQYTIDNIKNVRTKINKPLAIMLDTKGPEIRIKSFKDGYINLKKNRLFTFTTDDILGDETKVSLAYKSLINDIKIGNKIYANNGMIVLKVKNITENNIICKVIFGGKLTNGKGLNIPNISPKGNYLSEKDKQDLLFAIKNDVEIIAASFVSNKYDIIDLKNFLTTNGCSNIKIIAKIENGEGIKNVKSILQECDGIMVARGDLGVEIPLEKIPAFQKRAISLANQLGKICIVATEMLESMTTSVRPTRAEVSDVSNSIYEMATATMLSGETAVGKYPQHTVKTMEKIILETEKNIQYNKLFQNSYKKSNSITDSVSQSTCMNAINVNAKAIYVFTDSGKSADLISRYRINTPIVAITKNEKVYNSLALSWNIIPHLTNINLTEEDMITFAKKLTLKNNLASKNQIIVLQNGKDNSASNSIRVITL